jgi:hypothetical protein
LLPTLKNSPSIFSQNRRQPIDVRSNSYERSHVADAERKKKSLAQSIFGSGFSPAAFAASPATLIQLVDDCCIEPAEDQTIGFDPQSSHISPNYPMYDFLGARQRVK